MVRFGLLRACVVSLVIGFGATGFSDSAFAQKQGREDTAAVSQGNEEVSRLKQRVEQLEEQFVDMQVTVGTVESLGRRGGRVQSVGPQMPGNNGFSGGNQRIQMLETQIGALTRQVEMLSQRLNGGGNSDNYGFRQGAQTFQQGPNQEGSGDLGFGQVTVTPGGGVQPQSFGQGPGAPGISDFRPQPTSFDNRPPQTIYDEAYKYLLIQNYGAAEAAFTTFIKNHPNGKLAGNAQYWLGESFYVRGQYKNAADSFLKGYTVYAKSSKAPDSLLKLAMSLKRLGQKDAACSTFGELGSRFPRAPDHIKQRARSERRRSGC